MLRQHLHRLSLVNGRVQVLLQAIQEFNESLFVQSLFHDTGDALYKFLGDQTDLPRPVLPIQAISDLLDHLRIDPILQRTETKFQLASDFLIT